MGSLLTYEDIVQLGTPDGARAVIVRDRTIPLVTVNVRVGAGSGDDPRDRSGVAHILEHLLFDGSRSLQRGEHLNLIQEMGGFVNAKVSADWTKFFHVVSPDLVGTVMRMETDRFTDARYAMTSANLATEKQIVLRERLHRMTNVAYGDALERLVDAVYAPGTRYARLPIGIPEHVLATSVDDCQHFYDVRYAAPRVNVAIVGDVDPVAIAPDVLALLEVFGSTADESPTPGRTTGVVVRTTVATELRPKIFLGYALPSESEWGFDLARLAAFLLGRGATCRLTDRLIRRQRVAANVTVKTIGRRFDASVGVIEIVPAPDMSPDAVIAALDEAVNEPVTDDELVRARTRFMATWLNEEDSITDRGDALARTMQLGRSVESYLGYEDRMESVTAEMLDAVMTGWRPSGRRAELVYQP